MRQKKVVSQEEWAFFLKPALAQEGLPPNPSGEGGWLELKVWGSVIKGEEEVPGLAGLRAALEADAAPWRAYAESDAPQNAPLPAGWEGKVTPFQRLLLLKIFRPEKVVFAPNPNPNPNPNADPNPNPNPTLTRWSSRPTSSSRARWATSSRRRRPSTCSPPSRLGLGLG